MNSVKYIHQIIFSFILLLIFPSLLFSQFELNHCGFPVDSIIIEDPIQSSIAPGGYPDIAIDGVVSGSVLESSTALTHQEENPYWQARLTDIHQLYDIQIHFPADHYPSGLGNFYILTSEFDIFSGNLDKDISNPLIQSVHVNTNIPNGSTIPLTDHYAQYVQIQAADFSSLGLTEVNILGYIVVEGGDDEICGNGKDDDCDGRIDCEDPDCGPIIINANGVDPTCPLCADGQITVNIEYVDGPWDLEYSLDGGITFMPFNQNGNGSALHLFDNLLEGTYSIVVSNGSCLAETEIEIMAPRGDHNACFNGSFEDGTFEGWTAETGLIEAGILIPMAQNFGYQFQIIDSEGEDPNVGSTIPFELDYLGEYMLLITADRGNENGPSPNTGSLNPFPHAEYHKLNYCFEVTPENAEFNFNYALVLQNPADHFLWEQPYFEWEIINNQDNSLIFNSGRILADSGNDFFQVIEWPNLENASPEWLGFDRIVYRGWTCANFDLSAEIGNEVCVTFTISGCAEGGHGGMLYLDGLCSNSAESSPYLELVIDDAYCSEEPVDALLNNSENYDRFTFEICRYINGTPSECLLSNQQIRHGGNPIIEDVLGIYFGSLIPQSPLMDGDMFQFTVVADNECGHEVEFTKDFTYYDPLIEFDYPDRIVACPSQNYLIIPGSVNCNNCTIQWSPSSYLDDPTIENPTIDGTFFSGAFAQPYTITAMQELPDGSFCSESKEIELVRNELNFEILSTEIICGALEIIGIVSADFAIDLEDVEFRFRENVSGNLYEAQGVSINSNTLQYTGTIPLNTNYDFFVEAEFRLIETESIHLGCSFWFNSPVGTFEPEIFSRPWALIIGNVLTPNGDGMDDTFKPKTITTRTALNGECLGNSLISSITYMRLDIWNRWGTALLVSFEKTVDPSTATNGVLGSDIEWDGTYQGNIVQTGGYPYILTVQGCNDELHCGTDSDDCSNPDANCLESSTTEIQIVEGIVLVFN